MPRILKLAACQVGRTDRTDKREDTMARLLKLLDEAAAKGAQIALFPEIAFTTFFPRYLLSPSELEAFFEQGDVTTNPSTRPLFDKARELGVDICVGFAEADLNSGTSKLAMHGGNCFNTCIYYHASTGSILSKYRKIHLPGDFEPFANPDAVNQLEKRYFKPGDLGFEAFRVPELLPYDEERGEPIFGMMICNDRRWAESWRVLGLQGVEVVLCGYNTNGFAPEMWGKSRDEDPVEAEKLAVFHHKLVMQANSYTNSCFSVSAARCGRDDGKYGLIAGSCVTDPDGRIVAEAKTDGDEVVYAECDLEMCRPHKLRTFNFARHRRTEHYKRITEQTGVIEPPHLKKSVNWEVNGVNGSTKLVTVSGHSSRSAIRILLVNPNATPTMTQSCLNMLEPTLPPDVSVTGFTAAVPSPSAIESHVDNVLSSAASFRAIQPIAGQYDAFLVACYSDHALTNMLREEFDSPVIGIMEASLFAARTLGGRFGVIATGRRSEIGLTDAVRKYGFEHFCAGVKSCNLGVLDLERKPEKEVLNVMCNVAKSLVDGYGADVITLGCAGMSKLKAAVEEAVGPDVQVIDGVLSGVQLLAGMVRTGGKTAKKGVYRSSAVAREKRRQSYV